MGVCRERNSLWVVMMVEVAVAVDVTVAAADLSLMPDSVLENQRKFQNARATTTASMVLGEKIIA